MLFSEIIKESYEPREYPALAQLSDEWVQTRPFWGCKVLVATPIFRNTLVEYRALMAGGANLYVGYSVGASGAAMPCDQKIIDHFYRVDSYSDIRCPGIGIKSWGNDFYRGLR